ncbi:hydrogen peroxide-inducible genes activator [bacterium]|nr:hydrogen peroxide-inducible genes activator [bacterium]
MATITQLQYIVTVEKLKHFGKAADACYVSQPSLSAQIQKVEDQIGFAIFDRNKKPIAVTSRGVPFIEQAKIVLREHAKLISTSQQSQTELIGPLSLGIIPTVSPYLTPFFIGEFAKAFPKIQLQIEEIKTDSIIKALQNNEIDAGILATPLLEKNIIENPLYYEDFYLYVNNNHSLAEKRIIKESDLDEVDLWLLEDGHCFRNQVVKLCSFRKESPVFKNVSFQSGNLDTLRLLVKKNGGATILPASLVAQLPESEQRTYVRHFSNPIPAREISLVYHQTQWKLDLIGALQKTIVNSLPGHLQQKTSKKKNHVLGI